MRFWILIVLLSCLRVEGASYYVTVNGSDVAAGTEAAPYRTIQKGLNVSVEGDSIFVGPGDFGEYLSSVAHGNSGSTTNRIFLKSNATNTAASITRQFRLQHRFHWIEGITFAYTMDTNAANQNLSMVRVEAAATGTVVTNCVLRDTPWLDARFHFTTNGTELTMKITNSTGNFLSSNFVAGGVVYLGSDSLYFYTNHDRAVRIKSIAGDGQSITVTNSAATNFFIDSVQSRWAVVYSGQDNDAYTGVYLVLGGSSQGPTNCIITSCRATNLFGCPFVAYGDHNLIENNFATRMNSFYAIRPFGRHLIVRRNTWRNSHGIIWFSDYELNNIPHPPDASFFDYNVGAIHSEAAGTTNLLFEQNWVENFDQQLGVIDGSNLGVGGFTVRSNVFIGIAKHFSQNANWLTNKNNTFFRVSFDGSTTIGAGGINGGLQTNLDITSNVFVDCGKDHNSTTGWFTTTDTYQSNITGNFVCGPELTGWQAKVSTASAPITYNGGDPGFVNMLNPIGPDGLAFTDDDGLKPLPHSVLASNSLGALTPVPISIGTPIAHFSVTSPTNWTDYINTNWNTTWQTQEPSDRTGVVRPWETADPLGAPPVSVNFSAGLSIGGVSGLTNTYGIRYYGWSFGDGGSALTVLPAVSHTYMATGIVTVFLSITNFAGGWSQSSNTYRVLDATNSVVLRFVSTTGSDAAAGTWAAPWLTVQKAANTVNAGDYVGVLTGNYNEAVDCTRSASNTQIRFVGYGARLGGFNARQSKYYYEGFKCNFSNTVGNGAFYIYRATTNIVVVNNIVGPSLSGDTDKQLVYMELGSDGNPATAQQSHTFSNNVGYAIDSIQFSAYGRGHRIQGNILRDGNNECDLFRLWGADHVACDNFAWNICPVTENHADVFQIFGGGPDGGPFNITVSNIVVERNTILNSRMQVCQLENYTNSPFLITNIIFRNNIFNLNSGANIDIDGTKWYNNLFYRCTTNTGHVFVFGGPKGSAYGTEIENNILFMCGSSSANTGLGWYDWMEGQSISNYSLTANYNMVIGSNFATKAAAPPSASGRWGSTGGSPLVTWESSGVNGGNPLFVYDTNYDFRVVSGSPIINRGVTISGFSDDLTGNTRIGTWDMGPLEAPGGSLPAAVPVDSYRKLKWRKLVR